MSFFLINSSQRRLHQNQILSPVVRVAKLGLDWCLVPKVAENKYKYKHKDEYKHKDIDKNNLAEAIHQL